MLCNTREHCSNARSVFRACLPHFRRVFVRKHTNERTNPVVSCALSAQFIFVRKRTQSEASIAVLRWSTTRRRRRSTARAPAAGGRGRSSASRATSADSSSLSSRSRQASSPSPKGTSTGGVRSDYCECVRSYSVASRLVCRSVCILISALSYLFSKHHMGKLVSAGRR